MWIWGKITNQTLRQHIKREIQPETTKLNGTREEALQLLQQRLEEIFNDSWPAPKKDT